MGRSQEALIPGARAAQEGRAYIDDGRGAMERGDVTRMIEADMAFHAFIYQLGANPLIAPAPITTPRCYRRRLAATASAGATVASKRSISPANQS